MSRPSTATRPTPSASLVIRAVTPSQLEILLPTLVDHLIETVNGGASLGFLPPLGDDEARRYWLSLQPELRRGSRILLAAWWHGRFAGSGQLALSTRSNSPHRAEIHRLFVAAHVRGRGVGQALMASLHDEARRRGRSLLLLVARRGGPGERLYRRLGYHELGAVPGHTLGPTGERYEGVFMYTNLTEPASSPET